MTQRISMSAIILAGGKSSRMGRDKALMKFGEVTMLEYIVSVVTPLFGETLVIVEDKMKTEGLSLKKAVVYEDFLKNCGPMAGVYTGLCYSKNKVTCVFTCDMPLIDALWIEQFIDFRDENYDVVCLEDSDNRLHPFPGLYLRSCKHRIRLFLEQKELAMHKFLEAVHVKSLILQQEKIQVLTNMNTIQDYYRVLQEKGVKSYD